MDQLYSWSLLVSLVAATCGVLAGIFVLFIHETDRFFEASNWPRSISIRTALGSVVIGALSLLISVTTHREWGHGPASLAPMDMATFVLEHKAFLVAGLVVIVGVTVIVWAYKSQRGT